MGFISPIGTKFTRADVQNALNVPEEKRGGNWDTGYTEYDGEFFVFCNLGVAGRTGHDYDNRWEGGTLVWRAKTSTHTGQPQIVRLVSGNTPAHIFCREMDRGAFTYAGRARAAAVEDTVPVTVRWTFDANSKPSGSQEVLSTALEKAGFILGDAGVQTQKAVRGKLTVYIKQAADTFPLVVAPDWEDKVTDFELAGAARPTGRFYYHNSSMRAFPKRLHGGKQEIPFGLDLGFADPTALKRTLAILTGQKTTEMPEDATMEVDPRTESESVRAARLGQTKFRQLLLDKYGGQCAITEINMPEILRASHIKPWRVASAKERLDPENGILLAVHLDGLFDKGLISFDDSGNLLSSTKLKPEVTRAFGLDREIRLRELSEGNRRYLAHHRKHLFVE